MIGLNFLDESWAKSILKKKPKRMSELMAYPMFIVIENKSPAVSPKVVAHIFIIQNENVIAGSLFKLLILDSLKRWVKLLSKFQLKK